MARYDMKATFTRGEISPLASARQDTEIFKHGAGSLLNFNVLKEGGLRRRSGTKFAAESFNGVLNERFIDFVFSSSQAYALQMGNLQMQVWANGGRVVNGALALVNITSPYSSAQVDGLQYVTSNDTMFLTLASKTTPTQKLLRYGHDSCQFTPVNFQDGPYLPINELTNPVTVNISPVAGALDTINFANNIGVNDGAGLSVADIGRHLRVQFAGYWVWGKIISVVSTTNFGIRWESTQGVVATFPNFTYSWRLGAFSGSTGYPKCCAFYQGRMIYARTDANPRALWYSNSGTLEKFSPSDPNGTVLDSHGGMLEIIGNRADEILWLQEAPRLQIGTAGAIRSMGASDTEAAFGPRNVTQRIEINQGVGDVNPTMVGPSTMHVGRFGRTINDLFYDYQVNGLAAPNLSVVSEHLFKAQVKALAFQQSPDHLLWVLLRDGTLVSTTVERYEKIIGFARHKLAVGASGYGKVISMCVVPGLTQDDVYMIVERKTPGNVTKHYVEVLSPTFDAALAVKDDAFFVDCGAVYSGVATNTVSGLTWLANETVAILADGAVLPSAVVSALGVLTLPNGTTAVKIIVGLPMTASGKTLRAPNTVQAGGGSNVGRRVKVVSAIADYLDTLGLSFISDRGKRDDVNSRPSSTPMNQDPLLQTGSQRIMLDGSWASSGVLEFICDQPLPATILALNIELETTD